MTTPCVFTSDQQQKLRQWAGYLYDTPFEQGNEALHPSVDAFCCLGVFLQNESTPEWKWSESPYSGRPLFVMTEYDPDSQTTYDYTHSLPHSTCTALGLNQSFGEPYSCLEVDFMLMNDVLQLPFAKIADEILVLVNTGYFTPETMEQLVTTHRPYHH